MSYKPSRNLVLTYLKSLIQRTRSKRSLQLTSSHLARLNPDAQIPSTYTRQIQEMSSQLQAIYELQI
uniref:Uncharacterized protein n=1 Tax=Anguilla anguilla TaxID=7936 RepID=A0A0E9WQ39_ANGAN